MKRTIALGFLILSGNCFAGEFEGGDGNYYYDLCNTNVGRCTSYTTGLVDGLWGGIFLGTAGKTKDSELEKTLGFCMPASVNTGQAAEVFFHYLRDHPESRNERGATLAVMSWRQAWPCK